MSVADEALQSLIDDLIVLANTEVENASIKEGSETEVRRILRHFKRVTPTENCVNIADILNAAWRANHDEEFWQDLPFIRDKADLVLKELTLKNLEVFEIEQLLSYGFAMILKADKLAELLSAGTKETQVDPLVITPSPKCDELAQSGSASIDLRLGTWFSSLREARVPYLSVDDQVPTRQVTKTAYVPFGHEFVLHPGGFVLGVTLEWIRIPHNLAAYVVGKSSWGRWGLIIATAIGVHPGFKGCLTLELSNVGRIPIGVKPGMEICQLFFHEVKTKADSIDSSGFVGLRRPVFRPMKLDALASKLAMSGKTS